MEVRYYESLPLRDFKWRSYLHKKYKPQFSQPDWGDIQVGTMSVENFLPLKEDIRVNGCVNPLIVEYEGKWTVRTGNNRAEAMEQLGMSHVSAILIAEPKAPWPESGKLIRLDELREFLKQIWKGVDVKDQVYGREAWRDCKVLMEILF